MAKQLISIVTPCFNEELSIEECYRVTRNVMETSLSDFDYEHIFCDNASTDGTALILRALAHGDSRVRVILNSRNFGPGNSMFNGLLATRGDAVVPFLPADLQDPPEIIIDFVNKWQAGADVVFGVRAKREESRALRAIRKAYYQIVNRFANIDIPVNVGDFTLITRRVVTALSRVDDYYPYLRGLIANAGFKTDSVSYTWKSRKRGISKNNAYALVDQGLNGLISFTNIPMRLVLSFGFAVALGAIVYAVISVVVHLTFRPGGIPPGTETLIVGLFFFSGVILFSIGVLGEYVSAIHAQVRKRPLVVESERINF